jgi:hypothetical protein
MSTLNEEREEEQMTTAPHALGSNAAMATEATHVTGRRVLATVIDGLIKGFKSSGVARLQANRRVMPTSHAVPTP